MSDLEPNYDEENDRKGFGEEMEQAERKDPHSEFNNPDPDKSTTDD